MSNRKILDQLVSDGKDDHQARTALDDARTFATTENPSDLASVPRYMRWFESADAPTRSRRCFTTI